jgi:hypothetical protein
MADAEAEADDFFGPGTGGEGSSTKCACGSEEFLLQAYVHVVDGRARPGFVDVETLTCPQCGREFTAVEGEGDRILRGDFVGYADLGDDDED